MSRAFTKENDDRTSGSVVDRFYQGLLSLSDPARELIARRQQEAWSMHREDIERARRAAQRALGDDSYRQAFDSATQRAGDQAKTAIWWAIGDAAVGIASRRRLRPEEFSRLVGPLAVAMPWLKDAAGQA